MGRHLAHLKILQMGVLGRGREGRGGVVRTRRGWRQRWAGTSLSLRCSRWGLREGRISSEEWERVEAEVGRHLTQLEMLQVGTEGGGGKG